MYKSRITGIGHYVPETIVTNKDLEKYMDTTDEWIQERTGIKERRFFKEGVDSVAGMAKNAAVIALQRAGLEAKDIDLIVFATLTPDYYFPGSGVLLQRELGLSENPCIDVRAQCSGFIYGLSIADQYIKTGAYKNVLLACSEIQSNVMELSDRGRNMAVIFGDGAAAVILQRTDSKTSGVLSTHLHSDGHFAEELMTQYPSSKKKTRFTKEMIDDGSLLPTMNGKLVFKHAIVRFPQVIKEALDHNNLKVEDIDLLIPHQANLRISDAVQQSLGIDPTKVYNNIQKYGNTTAASIPICISECWEQGKIKEGNLICAAAFGSGFTWASTLIRW